ncbi:JmjC domain-containing histone demethylation protein 1 [Geranomyces variabilis]|uniref:JmjC domain-containing histone demethylation protein 1 n=1 Tax=Geranomyces variabilis TaxID=109894 RepID=A0AAD5TBY6_9FUNG|nr:JmjC domain-containing histone demethylation protein 1 [Geranomyces variabilis]
MASLDAEAGAASPQTAANPPELFCYCLTDGTDGEFMIQCDGCRNWYHGRCIDPPMAAEDTQYCTKFFCKLCEPRHGKSVFKEPTRKSKRGTTQINYNELNEGIPAEEHRFTKILQARTFAQESFTRLKGHELTLKWARKDGLREPVIVESPEGLDIKMPDKDLIVDQVADLCGRQRQVDAIEVSTQSERIMTLDEWAKYFHQPPEKRKRILNVISLEISQTALAEKIRRPRLVRDLDWTEQVWPRERKLANEYPKVQLYCLMSVKDSYTDFHIDFGGSSVFYHLLSGEKIFYFIPPTKTNLKKYEKWSSSPDQGHTFLSDEIKGGAIETHLYAGNTMIIPTGWIHAVFTPADSIVIGGNFLQGLNIAGQLEIHGIEERTNVPPKFRYPFFQRMQWYAARRYMAIAKHTPHVLSHWEIEGLDSLIEFLQSAATQMTDVKNVKKEERKGLRRHVPSDIKNVQKLLKKLTEHLNAAKSKRNQAGSASLRTLPDAADDSPQALRAPSAAVDPATLATGAAVPIPVIAEPISDGEDPQEWHSESEKEYLDSEDSNDSESDGDDYDDESSSADDEAYIPGVERAPIRKKSDTPTLVNSKASQKWKSQEDVINPGGDPEPAKPKRPRTQSPAVVDTTTDLASELTKPKRPRTQSPALVNTIPDGPGETSKIKLLKPQSPAVFNAIYDDASGPPSPADAADIVHHQPHVPITPPPQLAATLLTAAVPPPTAVAPIVPDGEKRPASLGTIAADTTGETNVPPTEVVAPKPREKKKPPTVKQRLNKLLNKKRR